MKRKEIAGPPSLRRIKLMRDSLRDRVRRQAHIKALSRIHSLILNSTVETGEEEEKTYFACKAKLFHFSDKEWRERGLGNFKVNVRVIDGVEDKKSARMVMRADGVLRVMLNTALFKGMKVGDGEGKEPRSKQIILASLEGNRSVPLLLRVSHSCDPSLREC